MGQMNRLIAFTVMVMLLMVPGCGGDTHESLADESMPVMKDMVATLETVKDEAPAKPAKPKLQSNEAKRKDLKARRNKLPAPTEAQTKAMMDKHGKDMEQIMMKLTGIQLQLMADPKIGQVLGDIDMKMR